MKSYLKLAEKHVIYRAKAYDDMLKIIDALNNFGNRACHEYVGKKKFFEGLSLMREAIYAEQSQALRECFYLVGVGGKEAEKYSIEMFEKVFCGDYAIMRFLEQWGDNPYSYKTKDEEEFKEECAEALKEAKSKGSVDDPEKP